ncbi:MAG: aminoacyl-histidine dipeptidase [Chlorobiaceae bacterium]|jgi:dipeptidase D|nr:aminoacyl-histidine dipeptidase [Chlorobiaceae bacterium]
MENKLPFYPDKVWKHFYRLTQIPRASGKEERVRHYIAGSGSSLGLETIVDSAGNVLVRKPATPGMEHLKGVILQSHLDMVPQKNSGKVHDFEFDPIESVVDGEWVRANGTTLGADNGIGVAAALAVLESDDLMHGPLEALFTANEEAGMSGAMGLAPGLLKGSILLNLDSEDEGELFIGCAGGIDAKITFTCSEEPLNGNYRGFTIHVTGLKGGHSGMDINLGRGNANKIMNRLLYHGSRSFGLQLASVKGGSLRNAIARESFAHVAIPSNHADAFADMLSVAASEIKNVYRTADPELKIEIVPTNTPDKVIDQSISDRLIKAVHVLPDGVMRMSSDMAGLVETSNNLAVVVSGEGSIVIECLLRSSVESENEYLQTMIGNICDLAGADYRFEHAYPGWKPNIDSPILKTMRDLYERKFGKSPHVTAVHAGLECGILGGTCPGLDMISFGPTIRYPHSPDEKVHIGSVGRFWDFLVETLRAQD